MSTSSIDSPNRATLVALALFLFSSCCASAPIRWEQLRQPFFQQLYTDTSPLEEEVGNVAQDKAGFIWLVAGTSLWRWDAYQFAAATVSDGEAVPIVQAIGSDPTGGMWVGTAKGLFRIVQGTTRMQRVDVAKLNPLAINFITFDSSGGRQRAFLATVNEVFEWDMRTQAVRSFAIGGAASNRIHALHLDGQGQLWVGTTEGLLQMRVAGSPDDSLRRVEQWPANTRVASIFTDHEKTLWVGTTISGLFYLDPQQRFSKVELPAADGGQPWVFCMTEIRPGLIWFGTYGSGILEYDVERKAFKAIQHNRLLKTSLADDNVYSLFRDQRGLIWVGGKHNLNLYDATQTTFTNISGDIGAGGLSYSRIHSVLAMPDDKLWLGTGENGIDIADPFQAEVRHIATVASKSSAARLPSDPIEAMLLADPNTVLASSNWLTVTIDRHSLAATPLHPAGRALDAYSSAFARYRDSTWISGTDGLWRVPDIRARQARNVFDTRRGEHRVASLLADGAALWVGTWSGLVRLQENPAPTPAIQIESVGTPTLDQQFIASMAIDNRGRLWLGTSSAGLFVNTRAGIAAKHAWGNITEANGLPANSVTSVLIDDHGGIWASTSRGIAYVDPNTLDVTSILPNQGAAAAPYIRASGAKNAAGEIVFGGLEGLTVVQPREWHSAPFKPRIVLARIETNAGKAIVPETLRGADGTPRTHLSVPPNIKRLTFEFAALDYVAAERLRYRYRLLGFDQNWRETDAAHRTASFTALPPDAYRLQVQASYDGRNWGSQGLAIDVDVAPAWYQKTWFRALEFLALALLLTVAHKARTGIYRRRQVLLERKVSERTAELHLANAQLQEKTTVIEQLSLTDPLTGLRNRRFLTQNIEADVSQALRRHRDHLASTSESLENADLIFFLVDIDFFKRVNDEWGHAGGDDVLVELRRRLMTVFRDSDYLIRWGGEEFLAVARDTSRDTAGFIAERIRQAVASEAFTVGNAGRLNVTCSVGFAPFPFLTAKPDALSWSETVAIADAALYRAKHDGRNTWVGFDGTGEDISDQQAAEIARTPEAALNLQSLKSRSAGET